MVCKNCGNEIRDDVRFCPHCGAVNSPDPGLPQGAAPYGAYAGPEAPEPPKKKKGLLIGGAVALAAVIILAVVAVSSLLGSSKGQVEKAMVKSAAAYAAAEQKLGLPDINQWQQDRSVFQSMSLGLNSINSDLAGYDLSALGGLEIAASAGYSGEDRYMGAEVNASWGLDELFLFRMVADNAQLYFHSPQFTGDTYYGVNTETLGADLAKMTGDNSMEDVSFNFFDLMEIAMEKVDREEMERAATEAGKTLWEAAKVKKEGAKTLDLKGTSIKTTAYQVIIPQEAIKQYVDDMAEVMSAVDYVEFYRELFLAMGMPQSEVDDFVDDMEEIDPYGQLAGLLKDALDNFGDLELEICLSDGYVSAVLYEGEINGEDVELALYLGGGEEYVDDLSVEIKVNNTQITIESTGDHSLKDGVYTDETNLRVRENGGMLARVNSELSYDPSIAEDNFRWELAVNSSGLNLFGLETQGSLYAKEDIVDLTLENAACKVMGMEVCSLRFNYRVSRCPEWLKQPMEQSRLITEMDMMELMTLVTTIQSNTETWLADMEALFAARLPADLYYSLF